MLIEQRSATRSVLFARVLLLLAAAALAASGIQVALRDETTAAEQTGGYSCPMHAEDFAATPGQCPICKMALVPLAEVNESTASNTEHPPDCPMHKKPGGPVVSALALEASTNPTPATGVTWLPET